jgi:hypothetical protein
MYAAADATPGPAYVAIVISLVALLAGVILCFLRYRARRAIAAQAEASAKADTPPFIEHTEVVLCGVVRHLADHDVAVKVSVTQAGSESESSGAWSHSWREVDREIIVAPFLLELANGDLVRVDPPKNVDVADALDQKVFISHNRRVLSAELVPGERIFVRGRLERSDVATASSAYREVTWGWVVRGDMLLSSEPLGAGLRQRASFHARFALIALALLVLTQSMLLPFYKRFAGETIAVEVLRKTYSESTDDEGHTHHHGYIVLERHNPELSDPSIEIDSVNDARILEGETVAIRYASANNWNLGPQATTGWLRLLFLALLPMPFWVWYLLRRRASRPWFRRKVDESGAGRL